MKSASKYAVTYIVPLCCIICFLVFGCSGQTSASKPAVAPVMSQRIAVIFRETLERGAGRSKMAGNQQILSLTFMPPSSKDVEEIRLYGAAAIPILANYLNSDTGFEKYLAMRFLGAIGERGIVEPLRKIVLGDVSSSFRLTALLWLSESPWKQAFPIFKQVAETDVSPAVREKAKYFLNRHWKMI